MRWAAGAITVLAGISGASGLFVIFDGSARQEECFIVEEPQQTQVSVQYEIKTGGEEAPPMELRIEVPEASGKEASFTRSLQSATGEVTFSTVADGNHVLCLKPARKSKGAFRLDLAIRVGMSDEYYVQHAREKALTSVEATAMRLNDDLTAILSEADYMKGKEVSFHSESESMNAAATWWPIFQISILLFMGFFQVSYLKAFFKSRKLV